MFVTQKFPRTDNQPFENSLEVFDGMPADQAVIK